MDDLSGSRYYQAILQLRDPTDAVLDFVEQEMESNKAKAAITNEKHLKNGIDLYITSKKFAKKLGEKLLHHFGGELKVNEKLFSRDRQTSKDIFRLNVMFRPLAAAKGDVIAVDKKLVRVTGLGKTISGVNIATGKRETINYKKTDITLLEQKKTTVSKVYPALEVLHPETFQGTPIENPKKLKPGEKVKVVSYKGLWLV